MAENGAGGRRVLVTGANRGIGLEFARQLAARGDRVFAGVRDPARAEEVERIGATVLRLDVDDPASVAEATARVERDARGLDLLVNNAGILPQTPAAQELGALEGATLEQVLRTNAVGPILLAQACLPLLRRGERPLVASISSGWGSVAGAGAGWPYAYCASKATLNMLFRIFAGDVRGDGIIALLLDPGWVRTDMGGPGASVLPAETVRSMLTVIDGAGLPDSGRFMDRHGRDEPF
jgi:NAD(P)-dependent dehydrogenase (short-subunit alcohol dehydrogenase family)